MTDGLTTYKFVIELDFTNLDEFRRNYDVEHLESELFEDVSAVLFRLSNKYVSLVGFKQDLELSTLGKGDVNE